MIAPPADVISIAWALAIDGVTVMAPAEDRSSTSVVAAAFKVSNVVPIFCRVANLELLRFTVVAEIISGDWISPIAPGLSALPIFRVPVVTRIEELEFRIDPDPLASSDIVPFAAVRLSCRVMLPLLPEVSEMLVVAVMLDCIIRLPCELTLKDLGVKLPVVDIAVCPVALLFILTIPLLSMRKAGLSVVTGVVPPMVPAGARKVIADPETTLVPVVMAPLPATSNVTDPA